MYELKLIKSLSYTGAVKASKANPFVYVKTKEEADALVKTGFFAILSEPSEAEAEAEAEEESQENSGEAEAEEDEEAEETMPDYEALAAMTKVQLVAYAEENGISVDSKATKAEILEAISVAYGGNETMIGLQR